VLEDADGSGTLAHDGGDLVHAQVADHAQEDNLGLVARQRRGDDPESPIGPEGRERVLLRVTPAYRADQISGVDRIGAATCTAALQVEEPAARDCESPGTERRLISSEGSMLRAMSNHASAATSCASPGVTALAYRTNRGYTAR
jgi:hypothetical protein